MKNSLITLIFLFSSHLLFSQNYVKTYYQLVNKAELEICNNNYSKAFKIYKKAFTKLEHPFYTDVKNAFVCGYFANKSEKNLKKYAAILTNKSNGFKDLIDSAYRDERYYRIKEYAEKTEITLDQYLVKTIDSLRKEDQKARKKCVAYKPECVADVMKADSTNRLMLVSLFEKYGNLTEENAGFRSMSAFYLMGIHNQAWCMDPFHEYIKKQVMNGTFDARIYAKTEDRKNTQPQCSYAKLNYGVGGFMILDSVLFIDNLDVKNKQQIDSVRNSIFLEGMDNLITKTLFVFNHPEFEMGADHFFFVNDPVEDRIWTQSMMAKIDNKEITNAIYFDLRKLK